jgi:hypothetical protein
VGSQFFILFCFLNWELSPGHYACGQALFHFTHHTSYFRLVIFEIGSSFKPDPDPCSWDDRCNHQWESLKLLFGFGIESQSSCLLPPKELVLKAWAMTHGSMLQSISPFSMYSPISSRHSTHFLFSSTFKCPVLLLILNWWL